MPRLKILTYPDPFLKKISEDIKDIDDNLIQLIDNMAETMYAIPGIGLAAPQVRELKRIIIYDTERKDLDEDVLESERKSKRNLTVLLNPKIISLEGTYLSENEGCLSVPGLRADIKRKHIINVEAMDIKGNDMKFQACEMEAVVIQHELDHLNGILFVDYLSALKRELYRRRALKKMKKKKRKK